MEMKDSMLVKLNESFSFGDGGIHRYQERLCVPDVEIPGQGSFHRHMVPHTPYIQVLPRCIIILDRYIGGMACRRILLIMLPSVLIVNRLE